MNRQKIIISEEVEHENQEVYDVQSNGCVLFGKYDLEGGITLKVTTYKQNVNNTWFAIESSED